MIPTIQREKRKNWSSLNSIFVSIKNKHRKKLVKHDRVRLGYNL